MDQTAEVAARVSTMAWAEKDRDSLLTNIASASPAASSGMIVRHKLQNYEAVGNYFPEFRGVLGAPQPTEPTTQKLTSLLLLCVEGHASALAMAPAQSHEFYKVVKKAVKAKGKGPPLEYIDELPTSPCAFQANHQAMFNAAFHGGGPAPCPFPVDVVNKVAASIPMRSTKRAASAMDVGCISALM
eukprot:15439505-Alexandrium_andersonii.AAC.2